MTTTLNELATTKISMFHRSVNVFTTDTTASKVLGELEETDQYEVVVFTGDRYGLVTIRDLLNVNQPEQTKLGDHSSGLWTVLDPVSPDRQVRDVAHSLINNNVRAIPVVQDGSVVGIISQVDISNALCDVQELSRIVAKELAKRPVVTLGVDEKITKARRLMLDKGFSHLPITKSDRLVGMVTAGAIVHTFIIPASRITLGERRGEMIARFPGLVSAIMDTNPFTLEPDASALDVARGMKNLNKSACIIVDNNNSILGILTPRELISIITQLERSGEPPVYILGLRAEDDFIEKEVAKKKVLRTIKRGMKMHPHITEVSIRIKRQQTTGNRVRYQMTARALSAVEQFVATAEGWNMVKTFDELCKTLDKTLKKGKHWPRRTPRRWRRVGRR